MFRLFRCKKVKVIVKKGCHKPSKKKKPTHCPRKVIKKKSRKVVVCPRPKIRVAAPDVTVSAPQPLVIPAPVVNVETPQPVVIPAPVVNVTEPEDACVTELRAELSRFLGSVIEVIDAGGAGAGGTPPNRIGTLEAVGVGTFVIRPTTGNPTGQVVYYSICEIIGFRPAVTVPAPAPIG
ncbi:hypothetical protein ACP26L_27090 [Paenibacillus sp. S-38]|uniref:hypothetical protein n=1 Tax=Paenibacillus sp. S-38 TaxID=3416710 RepID=UPI003CF4407A